MSSGWSASGLITGLDSASLIQQLLALDRAPETRIKEKISKLQGQQTGIRELRTQMTTLRNRLQDYRLNNIFNSFKSSTSEDTVLTSSISSSTPSVGSFTVNVTQLASSTAALSGGAMGASINPAAALNSSGLTTSVEAGTFTINGVEFTVDPATDTLNGILGQINASTAGVTATYDAVNDRVVMTNTTAGNTNIINLGVTDDTSNFLSAIGVEGATQSTGGTGSTTLTSTRHLGAVDPTGVLNTENFSAGGMTAGTFTINGIQISVDPTTDSLADVIERINSSDAGVSASYDAEADGIRVLSKTLGSRTISFGAAGDTSNFLSITKLSTAVQTAGNDAQFTVNGGPVQTRNTNEVADAISGVTLRILSTGTSNVTVSSDDDKIVEAVKNFITEFNNTVKKIAELTGTEGSLAGDSGMSSIDGYLRQLVFSQVTGVDNDYNSLMSIGISTGSDFDPNTTQELELDENKLREALRDNRGAVEALFSNSGATGVADLMYDYVDGATRMNGFLNERAKSNGTIDLQIKSLNDQIARIEDRVKLHETRLKRQFSSLEQMSSTLKSQSSALSSLGSF